MTHSNQRPYVHCWCWSADHQQALGIPTIAVAVEMANDSTLDVEARVRAHGMMPQRHTIERVQKLQERLEASGWTRAPAAAPAKTGLAAILYLPPMGAPPELVDSERTYTLHDAARAQAAVEASKGNG